MLRDWEHGVPLEDRGVNILEHCLDKLEKANHLVRASQAVSYWRLEQHIIDQAQELVDLKRLLKDHRALSLKICEPRLSVQRGHDKDRDAVILELLFDALEGSRHPSAAS